ALVGMAEPSTKSEMARSSECTEQYAQKVLDTADFVRDACLRQPFADQFVLAERWPDEHGPPAFCFCAHQPVCRFFLMCW
ncbi:MAG: hypothetical protein ABSG40_24175, partial [Terriglobales bacterium]